MRPFSRTLQPARLNTAWRRCALLLAAFALAACGQSDRVLVRKAVKQLARGDLIREMNRDRARDRMEISKALAEGVANGGAAVEDAANPAEVKLLTEVATPCLDQAANVAEDATGQGVTKLMTCLMGYADAFALYDRAIDHFMAFKSPADAPRSMMPLEELKTYLDQRTKSPLDLLGQPLPAGTSIRANYTDAELAELEHLRERRNIEASAFASKIFSVLSYRREVFSSPHLGFRYRLLRKLSELFMSVAQDGTDLGELAADEFKEAGFRGTNPLRALPNEALQLWLPIILMPKSFNDIEADLNPASFLPSDLVYREIFRLGGSRASVELTLKTYKSLRDQDNPAIPAHDAPAADATRVAFVDTGTDYVKYPQLALFLGLGRANELGQKDFSDDDSNSWSPYFNGLSHGSRVQATFMTLMSQLEPSLLQSRKVDLSMWKAFSLRSLLAGAPFKSLAATDARNAYVMATTLVDRIESIESARPHIVSMSVAGSMKDSLNRLLKPGILKGAPWLWVMAAGNEGVALSASVPSCFSDVARSDRLDARILCVGAIKRTAEEDRIAEYSNYGERVDVYAYESYEDRCPNGTSCATPAVTTAAAILRARFPLLGPEGIKRAIVAASVAKEMPVNLPPVAGPDGTLARPKRQVRFFDPVKMMDAAIAKAAELDQARAAGNVLAVEAVHSSMNGASVGRVRARR